MLTLRNTQIKTLVTVVACLAALPALHANPEERAQMLKTRILQRLIPDGWQLVQESQSLIVVERRISGWGAPVIQALTTGANGTAPVFRWSITVIPVNDHQTTIPFAGTINSQNAFGQTTSIPSKNAKDAEYIQSVLAWASAGLPKKYKLIKP